MGIIHSKREKAALHVRDPSIRLCFLEKQGSTPVPFQTKQNCTAKNDSAA
jgi:hypothetical protein